MSDTISEAAKLKACELANVVHDYPRFTVAHLEQDWPSLQAFARFIQQVSDAAKEAVGFGVHADVLAERLAPFILPDPVDPLEEVLAEFGIGDNFVSELKRRGLKIVQVQTC